MIKYLSCFAFLFPMWKLLGVMLLLAACVPVETNTTNVNESLLEEPQYAVFVDEGEIAQLQFEAIDPDNDTLTFLYEKPFDDNGLWQTHFGDAGEYYTTVLVHDGKGGVDQVDVLVVVRKANRRPLLVCPSTIVAREGATFNVSCNATDYEDGILPVNYSGFTPRTLSFSSAGNYSLIATAVDSAGLVSVQEIPVTVLNTNRAPEFPPAYPQVVAAQEGDIVTLDISEVYDADGDVLTFTYSEPFDNDGTWRAEQGLYPVMVVASDGTARATAQVMVKVAARNTAPVLAAIPDITVHEGEQVVLPLNASDADGDELSYTVEDWMTSHTYNTTYKDAGRYTTRVTVSDGSLEDSQVVHIRVLDVNRPPEFVLP